MAAHSSFALIRPELAEVTRQKKSGHKAVAEMLARGEFAEAVATLDELGSITRHDRQDESRAALVAQWTKDTAAEPNKSRFVFAYTNDDVLQLNAEIRAVRKERGELGQDHELTMQDGKADFAEGDRLIFTKTNRQLGIINGAMGTVERIEGEAVTLKLDGKGNRHLTFDAGEHGDFRHAYAGTIYKGQGRTFDEVYLYHSAHWRDAATYVALTRHREDAKLFVSSEVTRDQADLARQMGRHDDRRASVAFATQEEARQQQRERTTRAPHEATRREARLRQEATARQAAPPPRTPERQPEPRPPSPRGYGAAGRYAGLKDEPPPRAQTPASFADGAAKMADAILAGTGDLRTTRPPITAKEALENKELQAQWYAQRTAEMQAKGKEIEALRRMAKDKETGGTLKAEDVANLQPDTLREIRDNGDAELLTRIERQLEEERKRQRQRSRGR